jgi:hypothetical protein
MFSPFWYFFTAKNLATLAEDRIRRTDNELNADRVISRIAGCACMQYKFKRKT